MRAKRRAAVVVAASVVLSAVPWLDLRAQEQTTAPKVQPNSDAGLSPEAHGRAIAEEADRREAGFRDYRADVTMVLKDGARRDTRALRISAIEMPNDGDRVLLVFESPKDQKGTALLSYTHVDRDDEQWLWLPALARAKRIVANNRSGPFVASEFAFEDLTSVELDHYTYRHLDQVQRDGEVFERVERTPSYANSGYTRQVVWYDSEYRPRQVDFYDRRNELLKTYTALEFTRYHDRWWRAAVMTIVNHVTGKSTDMIWSNYQFGVGLDATNDFSVATLRRSR